MKWALAGLVLLFAFPASAADFPREVVLKVGAPATNSVPAKLGELVASLLPHYLPGNPTVSVEFVEGGSGVQLSRQLSGNEPADGSVLGAVSLVASRSFVLDPQGLGFDPSGLKWVASLTRPVFVCSVRKDKTVVWGETDLVFGAITKRDASYVLPNLLGTALNAGRVSVVVGFKAAQELYAASDRGEIDGMCSLNSFFQRDKRYESEKIVATFGALANAEPDVVNVLDRLSPLDQKAVSIATAVNQPYNTYAMPAGTPDDIVVIYRKAMTDLEADPKFAEGIKGLLTEYAPLPGDDVQSFVDGLQAAPTDVVSRALEMIR